MTVYDVLKDMGRVASNDIFDGVYEILLDASDYSPVGATSHTI